MSETKTFSVHNKGFHPLNPILCGMHVSNDGISVGPIRRDYWMLHYVVSGSGWFENGKKKSRIEAGSCFIIRPLESTMFYSDGNSEWKHIWIGFTAENAMSAIPEIFMSCDVIEDSCLDPIFSDIVNNAECHNFEAYLLGKLWQLIGELYVRPVHLSKAGEYAAKARSMIESECVYPDFTVEKVSTALHLERSYFSNLFKRETGISPQKYMLGCRMERAASLLVSSDCSVTEAASGSGYSDIFNFSRMFRRFYGISPSRYRLEIANKKIEAPENKLSKGKADSE